MKQFRGKKCDVLGFGVSNRPLVALLCEAGASVTVYDGKEKEQLGDEVAEYEARGVRFVCGKGAFESLSGEVIFRSPGIRPDLSGIEEAVARGAALTSEMAHFCANTKSPLFVITGSDGKTTSTTLTHLFLEAEKTRTAKGEAFVGGNIGAPLLPKMEQMTPADAAVLELSSFQLMDMDCYFYRAAITNVTPNHLDWHTGMEEYIRAKENAIRRASVAVLNADNGETARMAKERGRDMILFSSSETTWHGVMRHVFGEDIAGENVAAVYVRDGVIRYGDGRTEWEVLSTEEIRVPGKHNVENYMTAIAMTWGAVDVSVYEAVARVFMGVPHRLELVREKDGVRYYNSSIDSSPTRTAAALRALEGGIVAICGGYDKKIPMEPLAEVLCERVRAVVLTGATAQKIKAALLACPAYREGAPEILEAPNFADAVAAASEAAREGECVVLSPACASFDAFRNFAERGDVFKALVRDME